MIAATVQAPNPLSFLGEFMPTEIAPPALPADFAALLTQLKLVPAMGEAVPAEAPVAADAPKAEASEIEPDSGPVPDGLEEIAETLAAALAAVLAAAGKPAQTALSHRPEVTTKVAKDATAPATTTPDTIAPATMTLAAITLPGAALTKTRHPELVSGSTPQLAPSSPEARWMLKQVQHDGHIAEVLSRAPAAAYGAEASLAPILARIQAATTASAESSLAPPSPEARWVLKQVQHDQHFSEVLSRAPAAVHGVEASLAPILARIQAATIVTPESLAAPLDPAAPVDAAATDQSSAIPLPLPAPPLAASPTIPAATPATTPTQPQSSSEIVMTHHLDLAKDSARLDTLARDIARTANHDAQLRFQLNPEHLGSLRVELANSADGTAIRLTADTDAARNILADAQPRLIAEARAQGLRISEAQVDLGNQGGRQRDHQESPQPAVIRTQQPRDEQASPAPRSAAERYA